MTEDPFWKNIAPEYIWLAADFHGMTAVYTQRPVYMEKPARWGLPNSTGKRLDLSLLNEPPRDKAHTTLMIRPGYDFATGNRIVTDPPAPAPAPPKATVEFCQVVGQPTAKIVSTTSTNLSGDPQIYSIAYPAGGFGLDHLTVMKDMADLLEPILGALLAVTAATHPDVLAGPSSLMRQIVALSDRLAMIKNSIEVLRKVQNDKAP